MLETQARLRRPAGEASRLLRQTSDRRDLWGQAR